VPIQILGISWLGTRTGSFSEMRKFYEEMVGLEPVNEERDFVIYQLLDGDTIELFGPSDVEHRHFTTGPVAGFRVADVEAARRTLEQSGIEFFGEVKGNRDGYQWSHFRAPDGNVYELAGVDPTRHRSQPD